MSLGYSAAARGEALPWSKLDEEKVREIRRRHAEKEEAKRKLDEKHSIEALAADYGVSPNTIGKVLSFATWRHVL